MSEQPSTNESSQKSEGFPGFLAIGRLAAAVTRLLDGLRTLVREFAQLARAEIIVSAKALGTGIVLSLLAVGLTLLAAIFLMIAFAYALIFMGLPAWAAFLVVGAGLVLIICVLIIIARQQFKNVTLPTRTIAMLDEIGKPTVPTADGTTRE